MNESICSHCNVLSNSPLVIFNKINIQTNTLIIIIVNLIYSNLLIQYIQIDSFQLYKIIHMSSSHRYSLHDCVHIAKTVLLSISFPRRPSYERRTVNYQSFFEAQPVLRFQHHPHDTINNYTILFDTYTI